MTSSDTTPALRISLLTALIAVLFLALLSRLWFLQVLAGERYEQLAQSNEVEIVILEPPRGRILAADGEELVKNRPAQTISANRQQLLDGAGQPVDAEAEAVLDRLGALLDMTRDEILERMTSRKYSPFRPVPIKEDVADEAIFAVREHQELFPGVVAETLPVRTYPHDSLAAHVVGYIGEISDEQLTEEQYRDYRLGDLIGWAGLEKTYEPWLQGQEGERKLRVNARGAVLDVIEDEEPVRGHDLVTTLDLELQRQVERLLEDGILASRNVQRRDGRYLPSVAGSAVVLDPRNGEVRAMASWPSYDPSAWVNGISPDYFQAIHSREHHTPVLNRAVQGIYPPGSVFKIVSGAAMLEAGVVGPHTPVSCPPSWNLGGITFRNWNTRHEGQLALDDALKRSCDTYFYQLAYANWQRERNIAEETGSVDEMLPDVAEDFGLGVRTGIDLPSEAAGVIPGREWRREYWEENRDVYCRKAEELSEGSYAQRINADLCEDGGVWRGGDAVNSSIGQGDVLTTPLQIATAYAGIANDGTVMRPHVGKELRTPEGGVAETIEPGPMATLPLDAEELATIQRGLEKVVMEPRGTANFPFRGFPLEEIPVAGKTGTAEMKPKVPYAWFVAYAPADDPRYVVVVSVEEGGGGSQTGAPIARRILEAAFDLPISEFEAGPGNVD